MKTHWTALGIGVLIGAALGWWMGSKPDASKAGGGTKITGSINAPFQSKISRS